MSKEVAKTKPKKNGTTRLDGEVKLQGRPTKLTPENKKLALAMVKLGASLEQVADELEINVTTLYHWKKHNEPFSKALKEAQEIRLDRIEGSFMARAEGQFVEVEKTYKLKDADGNERLETVAERVYYPPDITAGIFTLKNLRRDKWRDKHDIEASGGIILQISDPFGRDEKGDNNGRQLEDKSGSIIDPGAEDACESSPVQSGDAED